MKNCRLAKRLRLCNSFKARLILLLTNISFYKQCVSYAARVVLNKTMTTKTPVNEVVK